MFSNALLKEITSSAAQRPRMSTRDIDATLTQAKTVKLQRPPSDHRLLRLYNLRKHLEDDVDDDEEAEEADIDAAAAVNVSMKSDETLHNHQETQFTPTGCAPAADVQAWIKRSLATSSDASFYWCNTLDGEVDICRMVTHHHIPDVSVASYGSGAYDLIELATGDIAVLCKDVASAASLLQSEKSSNVDAFRVGPLTPVATVKHVMDALNVVDLWTLDQLDTPTMSYILRVRREHDILGVYYGSHSMLIAESSDYTQYFDAKRFAEMNAEQSTQRPNLSILQMPAAVKMLICSDSKSSHPYALMHRIADDMVRGIDSGSAQDPVFLLFNGGFGADRVTMAKSILGYLSCLFPTRSSTPSCSDIIAAAMDVINAFTQCHSGSGASWRSICSQSIKLSCSRLRSGNFNISMDIEFSAILPLHATERLRVQNPDPDHNLARSYAVLKLSPQAMRDVERVCDVVSLLNSFHFIGKEEYGVRGADIPITLQPVFDEAATLLGMESSQLKLLLTTKRVITQGEKLRVPIPADSANLQLQRFSYWLHCCTLHHVAKLVSEATKRTALDFISSATIHTIIVGDCRRQRQQPSGWFDLQTAILSEHLHCHFLAAAKESVGFPPSAAGKRPTSTRSLADLLASTTAYYNDPEGGFLVSLEDAVTPVASDGDRPYSPADKLRRLFPSRRHPAAIWRDASHFVLPHATGSRIYDVNKVFQQVRMSSFAVADVMECRSSNSLLQHWAESNSSSIASYAALSSPTSHAVSSPSYSNRRGSTVALATDDNVIVRQWRSVLAALLPDDTPERMYHFICQSTRFSMKNGESEVMQIGESQVMKYGESDVKRLGYPRSPPCGSFAALFPIVDFRRRYLCIWRWLYKQTTCDDDDWPVEELFRLVYAHTGDPTFQQPHYWITRTNVALKAETALLLESLFLQAISLVTSSLQLSFRRRMWRIHVFGAARQALRLQQYLAEDVSLSHINIIQSELDNASKLRLTPPIVQLLTKKLQTLRFQQTLIAEIKEFISGGYDPLEPENFLRLDKLCNDAYDNGISAMDPVIAANKMRASVADRMEALSFLRDGVNRCDTAAIQRGIAMVTALQNHFPGFGQVDADAAKQLSDHLEEETNLVRRAIHALQQGRCADMSSFVANLQSDGTSLSKLLEILMFGVVASEHITVAFPPKKFPTVLSRRTSASSATHSVDSQGASSVTTAVDATPTRRKRRLSQYEVKLGLTAQQAQASLGDAPQVDDISSDPADIAFMTHKHAASIWQAPMSWSDLGITQIQHAVSGLLEKSAPSMYIQVRDSIFRDVETSALEELQDVARALAGRVLLSPISKTVLHSCNVAIQLRQYVIAHKHDGALDVLPRIDMVLSGIDRKRRSKSIGMPRCFKGFLRTFSQGTTALDTVTTPDEDDDDVPELHPVMLAEIWGVLIGGWDANLRNQIRVASATLGPCLWASEGRYEQGWRGVKSIANVLSMVQGEGARTDVDIALRHAFDGFVLPISCCTFQTAVDVIIGRQLLHIRATMLTNDAADVEASSPSALQLIRKLSPMAPEYRFTALAQLLQQFEEFVGCLRCSHVAVDELHTWRVVSESTSAYSAVVEALDFSPAQVCWGGLGIVPWVGQTEYVGVDDIEDDDGMRSSVQAYEMLCREVQMCAGSVQLLATLTGDEVRHHLAWRMCRLVQSVLEARKLYFGVLLGREDDKCGGKDVVKTCATQRSHKLLQLCKSVFEAVSGSKLTSVSSQSLLSNHGVWSSICDNVSEAVQLCMETKEMDVMLGNYIAASQVLPKAIHDVIVLLRSVCSSAIVHMCVPLLSETSFLISTTQEFAYYTNRCAKTVEAAMLLCGMYDEVERMLLGDGRTAQGDYCAQSDLCFTQRPTTTYSLEACMCVMFCRCICAARSAFTSGDISAAVKSACIVEKLLRIAISDVSFDTITLRSPVEEVAEWVLKQHVPGTSALDALLSGGDAANSTVKLEFIAVSEMNKGITDGDPSSDASLRATACERMIQLYDIATASTWPILAYACAEMCANCVGRGQPNVDPITRRLRTDNVHYQHIASAIRIVHPIYEVLKHQQSNSGTQAVDDVVVVTLQQLQQISLHRLEKYLTGLPLLLDARKNVITGNWDVFRAVVQPTPGTSSSELLDSLPPDIADEFERIAGYADAARFAPFILKELEQKSLCCAIRGLKSLDLDDVMGVIDRLSFDELGKLEEKAASFSLLTNLLASLILSAKYARKVRAAVKRLDAGAIRALKQVIHAHTVAADTHSSTSDSSSDVNAAFPMIVQCVLDDVAAAEAVIQYVSCLTFLQNLLGFKTTVLPSTSVDVRISSCFSSFFGSWQHRGAIEAGTAVADTDRLVFAVKQVQQAQYVVETAVGGHTFQNTLWLHVVQQYVVLRQAWHALDLEKSFVCSQELAPYMQKLHEEGTNHDLVDDIMTATRSCCAFKLVYQLLDRISASNVHVCIPLERFEKVLFTDHALLAQCNAFVKECARSSLPTSLIRLLTSAASVLKATEDACDVWWNDTHVKELVYTELQLKKALCETYNSVHSAIYESLRRKCECVTQKVRLLVQESNEVTLLLQQCRMLPMDDSAILKMLSHLKDTSLSSATELHEESAAAVSPMSPVELLRGVLRIGSALQHRTVDIDTITDSSVKDVDNTSLMASPGTDVKKQSGVEDDLRTQLQHHLAANNTEECISTSIKLFECLHVDHMYDAAVTTSLTTVEFPESCIPGFVSLPHTSHSLHRLLMIADVHSCPKYVSTKRCHSLTMLSFAKASIAAEISNCLLAVGGEYTYTYPEVLLMQLIDKLNDIDGVDVWHEFVVQWLAQLRENPSIVSRCRLWCVFYTLLQHINITGSDAYSIGAALAVRYAWLQTQNLPSSLPSPWYKLLRDFHKNTLGLCETNKLGSKVKATPENIKKAITEFETVIQRWLASMPRFAGMV